MIIEKRFAKYTISLNETISAAVRKIVEVKARILIVIDESGKLKGLFTHGDFLRWLDSQSNTTDLRQSIELIVNENCKKAFINDAPDKIKKLLESVLFVPLIDQFGRLKAVARRRHADEGIQIGDAAINASSPTYIIAEIGNNHNGSMKLARKLVDLAIDSGADCVKFQMRNMESLYCHTGDRDDNSENLGTQYTLDLLSKFQLSNDELFRIFDYCKQQKINVLCTPWDIESAKALEKYGMPAFKVASADLTNHDLLSYLASTSKPLLCSTGMSTEREITQSVQILNHLGAQYILLHCNSAYPPPLNDINLNYLKQLKNIGKCIIGYSGHERGWGIAIAAVAKGAKVIEKHFTVDRTMEGSDHKISLLPGEFKDMVNTIRQVEKAIGTESPRKLSQGEILNRVSLAKSLMINRDLSVGEEIKEHMIVVKGPGQGLQPHKRDDLIGKRALRDFKNGDFFYPSDLDILTIQPRNYTFKRKWGLPVRYHDFKSILTKTNPDLIEFHYSFKDLLQKPESHFDQKYDLDLIVHCPELFAGDHVLDLTAKNNTYRKHSIKELQRVIDITRKVKTFFPNSERTLIVTNIGGFSENRFLYNAEKQASYDLLVRSLDELDTEGVEIIPQTMPPFPWHFGGQRYHNLFTDPDMIKDFCMTHSYRLCLDLSHSKLACNYFGWSFFDFIKELGPYIAHMHIADAKGSDGEGLQINDGEIDFSGLVDALDQFAPDASFIPEIWQGHENQGEGFWIAQERLEKYMS